MNMLSSTAARSFASSTTTVHESRPASEYNKEIDLELDSPGLELDDFSIPATPTVTTGTRPRSMTTERVLASLPPADQGREAYLFLFAGEIVLGRVVLGWQFLTKFSRNSVISACSRNGHMGLLIWCWNFPAVLHAKGSWERWKYEWSKFTSSCWILLVRIDV